MERAFEPVSGIFDAEEASVFTKYRVAVTFTQLVMGGVPQKPEVIESWLRQRVLGGDEELRIMLIKTLEDLEIEVPTKASREEIIAAAKEVAATRNGNTFRRDRDGQLCLAGYNPKAMMKEAVSILYPSQVARWGPTNKAPKGYLSERVFVDEYLIPLGRGEPDTVWTQVGHVSGPRGKRSTLTYYDACAQPEAVFTLSSAEDCITADQWKRMLILGERLGMGAIRSMGHGQFRVTALDRL